MALVTDDMERVNILGAERMSEKGYCKYCDRQKPIEQIEKKKEIYVQNGIKVTSVWIGCKDCWERLQRVS